jgi:hypothetical protein
MNSNAKQLSTSINPTRDMQPDCKKKWCVKVHKHQIRDKSKWTRINLLRNDEWIQPPSRKWIYHLTTHCKTTSPFEHSNPKNISANRWRKQHNNHWNGGDNEPKLTIHVERNLLTRHKVKLINSIKWYHSYIRGEMLKIFFRLNRRS